MDQVNLILKFKADCHQLTCQNFILTSLHKWQIPPFFLTPLKVKIM